MPRPHGTTTRGTERTKGAQANLEYRQRKVANNPEYTACEICGVKLKGMGHGSHRRQHILNGEIEVELPFECEECGERYEVTSQLRDHVARGHQARTRPTMDDPVRRARVAFVNSIAELPYPQFIELLHTSGPPTKRVRDGHDSSKEHQPQGQDHPRQDLEPST